LESELFGHEKGAFTGAQARVLGKVEYADKGTLFLDEIGELPASLQVNLLRFLQEKVIQRVGGRENIATDTRVLAATNLDVEKAIAGGTFREDLYYRLGVISIKLPPLRERKEDIAPLAHYFLQRFAQEFSKKLRGFGPSALEAMMNYGWPGNVRELENKVKRAAIMAEGAIVRPEDLGFSPGSPDAATAAEAVPGPETPTRPGPENPGVGSRDGRIESLWEARSRVEADLLARALEQHEGNVARAAEAVGISRPTFYDLMKKHGMRCEE
jgi:two-component system NtrC family response regulator